MGGTEVVEKAKTTAQQFFNGFLNGLWIYAILAAIPLALALVYWLVGRNGRKKLIALPIIEAIVDTVVALLSVYGVGILVVIIAAAAGLGGQTIHPEGALIFAPTLFGGLAVLAILSIFLKGRWINKLKIICYALVVVGSAAFLGYAFVTSPQETTSSTSSAIATLLPLLHF